MRIVLLRVGADYGTTQTYGPIFKDGRYEFLPIPDRFHGTGVSKQTYNNTTGHYGCKLIDYFPQNLRLKYGTQPIHYDPEFCSFTYGDPTTPKAGLRNLSFGDILVFYAGLKAWNFKASNALYIIGYFRVRWSGIASYMYNLLGWKKLKSYAGNNFHIYHKQVFKEQIERLVIVKGHETESKQLERAVKISAMGKDRNGRPLFILSSKMQKIFGNFDGHVSLQRSPPRWVLPRYSELAERFLLSLK